MQHLLHAQATIGPAVVLLLAVIVFSLLSTRFLQPANISLVLQQVAVVGTIAVGQTIIILTAGIDLSCGAIMVLTSIVMAKVSAEHGLPGVLALLLGFLVGAGCGLVNGLLVTRLKLPPFIVTLGTLNVFFALNLWYSGSATIRGTDMPALLLWTGQTFTIGGTRVTYGSIGMVLLVALVAFVLKNTAWGRHIYATGDDAEAARLSGIRTNRVLLSAYGIAGVIYALSAWVLIGRIASASPQAGQLENLDSITAVVIGGTSLFGGRGAVVGSLLGALIVGVFRNGLALARVDVLWQTLAVGVLVIVAVSLDQWIRKVRP
ncbi:ABC transporter permease [Solihabitans fulvus]|uniref:ABC transporter permease n=1 Tax=Solihabitans fulvus TaxID=1892852 RepID=UPI001CB764AA|nr:ABC transporter permease [Solihabitans fulvus]